MDQNNYALYPNTQALPKLHIFQAITQTAYPVKFHDSIVAMLYEKFPTNSKIYLMNIVNDINNSITKIIVIQSNLQITHQSKLIPLSILIYFMPFFPSVGPEVYLEKKGDLVINQKLENIIGKETLRVNYENYVKWNGNVNSIDELLSWLKITFDLNFPVFHTRKPTYFKGNCNLNMSNLIEISLVEEPPKKIPLNSIRDVLLNEQDIIKINKNTQNSNNFLNNTTNNNKNMNNYNSNNYNNYTNSNDNNGTSSIKKEESLLIDFSQFDIGKNSNVGYHEPDINDVCMILRREILFELKPRINEIAFNILSKFEDLNLYKMKLNMIVNTHNENETKYGSLLTSHYSLSLKLDNDITLVKKDIIRMKQIESLTVLQQIENLFLMSNESKEMILWLAKEQAIEENLLVLKRKFNRTKSEFALTVKLIRELSRELFTIKYKINEMAKIMNV